MIAENPPPTWDERPERLKAEWTGRRVRVRGGIPSLARFAGLTGVVRTVNMNGRPIVEFEDTPDVTWYDLEFAGLEVVEQGDATKAGGLQPPGFERDTLAPAVAEPDPRPMPGTVTRDSPTQARHPEKPLSVLELARQQGAVKKT